MYYRAIPRNKLCYAMETGNIKEFTHETAYPTGDRFDGDVCIC